MFTAFSVENDTWFGTYLSPIMIPHNNKRNFYLTLYYQVHNSAHGTSFHFYQENKDNHTIATTVKNNNFLMLSKFLIEYLVEYGWILDHINNIEVLVLLSESKL